MDELQHRLQNAEKSLRKLEASARSVHAAKASVESKLQKLQVENANLLRRESQDKDMIRKAATIVSQSVSDQVKPLHHSNIH